MAAPKPATQRERSKPDLDSLEAITSTEAPRRRVTKAPQEDAVLGVSSLAATPAAPAAPKRTRTQKPKNTPAPKAEKPKPQPAKKKVGFYQAADDIDRARAAWFHTRSFERSGSWSDFIAAAVLREAKRMEAAYNDGKPWPAVKTGSIPTGRPADE